MGKEDYVSVPLYDHESIYPVKAPKTAAVVNKKKSAARSFWCSTCMKVLIGLFVVFAVVPFCLLSVAFISGYVYVAGKVKMVTVTEQRVLPVFEMPESELEMAKDRVTLFWDDLAADRVPAQDLIVTADEINGFIATSDYMRGNAYVHLEDNKLTFETSLPASFLPGGRGRYFVSTTVAAVESGAEDTLAVDVDAPVEVFQGKLVTALLKFGMDADNKHHVMNLLYGNAFGAEPCEKFYQEHNNILDLVGDDDDGDEDFSRVIDNLGRITFLNDKIVFTAAFPTPLESSTETTSRLSPWHLLRRLF